MFTFESSTNMLLQIKREHEQEREQKMIQFVGFPYDVSNERQLGRAMIYVGIVGELEIASLEEDKKMAF